MTGYASIGSAIEATRAGAAGYLPKPFTPEELESTLERVTIVMTPRPAAKASPKALPKADEIIDVDMPFGADEVAAATSAAVCEAPDPVRRLPGGFLRARRTLVQAVQDKGRLRSAGVPAGGVGAEEEGAGGDRRAGNNDFIDVDMPFSFAEVAASTSEAYADALGRSDMAVAGRWNAEKAAGRKILVVDDEVVAANSVRRTLTRRGFRVDEAFSGREALNRILNEMYDLVLLDMKMPDTNGLELLPTIKKHRPALPVVMVTGYASIDTAVEAIQRGATDYVAKPFTPDELFSAASKAIRRAIV